MFEKEPVVVGGTISQPHRGMVELSKGFAKQKMRILDTKLEHIVSRLSFVYLGPLKIPRFVK